MTKETEQTNLISADSKLQIGDLPNDGGVGVVEILESIADAFFAINREWRFTYVNPQSERLLDRVHGELIGKTLWEEYPGLIGSPFEKLYRDAMDEKIGGTLAEFYPDHKRYYEVTVNPVQNGITVFFRNVTERIESERRLRESEHFTQDVLDSLTMHISVLDKNGVITAVNEAWKNFAVENGADWAVQGVGIGTNYLNVCRSATLENSDNANESAEADLIYKGIRDVLSGANKFFSIEYPCHSPAARQWFLLTVSPLAHSPDGGVVVAHLNVTTRRLAEKKLRESEEQFRALADSIPQLAWMAEADGFIFWYNERWYDFTGTTSAQMEGWGWQSVHDAEMLPKVMERWQSSIKTGASFEMEFPLRRGADGKFRWFLTRVVPVCDADGRILRWFGTNTDIEELRQARLQAEQANRLKDEFLATVSHELRTPLNAILGWSQMLNSGKATGEVAVRASQTIYRSAKSQAQLIEDLLDVSRIITGKLLLEARPVELEEIVGSAVEALRPAIDAKKIKFKKIFGSTEMIVGDAGRLQQIVWNLLSNAVKFTPENKTICVEIEEVGGGFAQLTVTDDGIGIASEVLPFIFERFRQADGSTTRKYGGLGLGLAIVRHLVELHGGTIYAESAGANHGAKFQVRLPLFNSADANNAPQSAAPAKSSASGSIRAGGENEEFSAVKNLRVLVVDDEPAMLELLELALGESGAVVKSAASADSAFEIFKEWQPDLLISDIAMPERDGFWLIERVRELSGEQGGKIPAIALTAYARPEDRNRILAAGFQMFTAKPVEPDELLRSIGELRRKSEFKI